MNIEMGLDELIHHILMEIALSKEREWRLPSTISTELLQALNHLSEAKRILDWDGE